MNEKIGRNDPCPCGSGKKYKSCCMNKQAESKKLYTPSGKRKFKAKVIDSSASTHEVFSNMSASTPATQGNPDVFKKLRFRMSEHDYRQKQKEAPTESLETEPAQQNLSTHQPHFQPGSDFHLSSDDFRIEEK